MATCSECGAQGGGPRCSNCGAPFGAGATLSDATRPAGADAFGPDAASPVTPTRADAFGADAFGPADTAVAPWWPGKPGSASAADADTAVASAASVVPGPQDRFGAPPYPPAGPGYSGDEPDPDWVYGYADRPGDGASGSGPWAPAAASGSGSWGAAGYPPPTGQPPAAYPPAYLPPAYVPQPPPPSEPRRRRVAPLVLTGVGVLVVALVAAYAFLWGPLKPTPTSATPTPLSPAPTAPAASTVGTPTLPSVTPASPTPQVPTTPPAATVAIGAWKATCDNADADAAALLANLGAQPQFAVAAPSGVAGYAAAATAAAKPMYDCPVAHSLRVRERLAHPSDPAATTALKAGVSAMLRTVLLTLGSTKVGRFPFGSVTLAEAKPVYVAVLGEPDKVQTNGCEMSGQQWTQLVWGGLVISFDDNKAGKPLESWWLNTTVAYPKNLEISDAPLSATLAELRAIKSSVSASSMFGDGAPYAATLRPGLTYIWDNSPTERSTGVNGGPVHGCE